MLATLFDSPVKDTVIHSHLLHQGFLLVFSPKGLILVLDHADCLLVAAQQKQGVHWVDQEQPCQEEDTARLSQEV
jgi:hypothetical protein